jgi:hypothetical protein
MVNVALPIFPVAVSGGLVCAHAGLSATSRLTHTRKYFIDLLLFFIHASRATLHVGEKIRKRAEVFVDGGFAQG